MEARTLSITWAPISLALGLNLPKGQIWKLQVGLDTCGVGSLRCGRSDMIDEWSFVFGAPSPADAYGRSPVSVNHPRGADSCSRPCTGR